MIESSLLQCGEGRNMRRQHDKNNARAILFPINLSQMRVTVPSHTKTPAGWRAFSRLR
jgi:hypothetical protein